MGSFKGGRRGQKPGPSRGETTGHGAGSAGVGRRVPSLEALESRTLLASGINNQLLGASPFVPTSADWGDVKHGPLATAGPDLIKVFAEFNFAKSKANAGNFGVSPLNSQKDLIRFAGDSVYVDVQVRASDGLNGWVTGLKGLGMIVTGTDGTHGLIEGVLPISKIPSVALNRSVVGVSPIYRPQVGQRGIANNQADIVQRTDLARQQFKVDGTGVTVGVLSDSVSRFAGGLADSVGTGDLPGNVNVLLDAPVDPTNTDEGRAMLEEIHDIAPGSGLAFNTAGPGQVGFANGIRNLANVAGAKVIVDDVLYFAEPMFQDGIIAQAVTDVVNNNGVTYLSHAENSGNGGYESPYRSATTTVGPLGSGRYMDFDPGPGVAPTIPVRVNSSGALIFQYDQPFYTTSGVTSDVDIYLLDATGATIVAAGNSNNIATQQPLEIFGVAPGDYTVAIKIESGPDVGRVRFQGGQNTGITVSPQYGTAGGAAFVSTYGHPTVAEGIGVGAVAWFDAPPTNPAGTISSETFSAFGPANIVFNADGTRKALIETRSKPDISAVDGINTSFFGRDIQQDPDTLPNFFGTSAAAPNAAALVALVRELNPTLTPAAIKSNLIASATPLNGTAKGQYDPQGGFGLVNATAALTVVQPLRVTAVTPPSGQTTAVAPGTITFTFAKPVSAASLSSAVLNFTGAPPGITVTVGTPTLTSPNTVSFPVSFTPGAGANANGAYTYTLGGGLVATDGAPLIPFSGSFGLADTISPKIAGVQIIGRYIGIQFTEPMRASTVNRDTVLLVRTGPVRRFGDPSNIIVNADPRVVVRYDPVTNRAFMDLSQLDQASLPSDFYALVVLDSAVDQVGNPLDGEFAGQFPTGDGVAGGRFIQNLGFRTLRTPIITGISLAPTSDTGLPGDQNTRDQRPTFVGNVTTDFPGTVAGLVVAIEFNGLNNGLFNLTVGPNNRGFVTGGNPASYVFATTDGAGNFTFQAPANLPDGFNQIRAIVVGQTELAGQPGLSSTFDQAFRVDTTSPVILTSSLPAGSRVGGLLTVSLTVADTILPSDLGNPLSVPVQLSLPALDPRTASNLSNYALINTTTGVDYSSLIASAVFVPTSTRARTNDPYTGRIDLSFSSGAPAGRYNLILRTPGGAAPGITDAAGNPLDGNVAIPGAQDFVLPIDIQPEPAYVTKFQLASPTENTLTRGQGYGNYGPRSYFELPDLQTSAIPNSAPLPPNQILIDFSNPLRAPGTVVNPDFGVFYDPGIVQVLRSGNNGSTIADGDFGLDGLGLDPQQGRTLATAVTGYTVRLMNSIPGATFGQPGYLNRLMVTLPLGANGNSTLLADHYRVVLPNSGANALFDAFGNQVDGEFLGNPLAQGLGPMLSVTGAPEPDLNYEDFLPNGLYRQGLSGDGVAGGVFATSFVVVPAPTLGPDLDGNGGQRVFRNIIFARPDYVDSPFQAVDDPDGSINKPYAALAPEAVPSSINGGRLNSQLNFGTGFDVNYDRNANGRFDRSAVVAATEVNSRGPVVIVALPKLASSVGSAAFVAQASPSFFGTNPAVPNDGSFSLPFDTTLAFGPGSILKMQNATLFAQNQGTSVLLLGGSKAGQQVTITSLADDSVGGDTNRDGSSTTPRPGDFGGIALRNFQQDARNDIFPVDGRLKGPLNTDAFSGADDLLSSLNFLSITYAGGVVPISGSGATFNRYDSITNFNSRPAITNSTIGKANAGSLQAAISADLDSLREDSLARGLLVRRTSTQGNSINGILIRSQRSGQVRQSNAIPYPDVPASLGGQRNFVLDDTLPYVLISRLILGDEEQAGTGGDTVSYGNRLYIQPGMLLKAKSGAGIEVLSPGFGFGTRAASINVGDRTYIRGYDRTNGYAPVVGTFNPLTRQYDNGATNPDFKPNDTGDAKVLFTSFFDDVSSTTFFDSATQQTRVIVGANDAGSDGNAFQPSQGNIPVSARWGGLTIDGGGLAVVDEARFQYGGGALQLEDSTDNLRPALTFQGTGSYASITNNDFVNNFDAAISAQPNNLLAGDSLRPLFSGNPFFRGNIMVGNTYNGLRVSTSGGQVLDAITGAPLGERDPNVVNNLANLSVDSLWDDTDLTYILRGSIGLAGRSIFSRPLPSATGPVTELTPSQTLTIQSSLPDSLLANGQRIGRPGESALVKLLTFQGNGPAGDGVVGSTNDSSAGAGFIVGVDDGNDPPGDPLIDPGLDASIRIVGIPGNEATGQQRVPVVMTSLLDNTVGRTVRGVTMNNTYFQPNPRFDPAAFVNGVARTTPRPGDWGLIYFGGNSIADYNLLDPRNGSIIDNADITYATRIEMQGGGVSDVYSANGDNSLDEKDNVRVQKLGLAPTVFTTIGTGTPPQLVTINTYLNQFNTARSWTISNSNLSDFSQTAVLAHPGFNMIYRDLGSLGGFAGINAQIPRSGLRGQPIDLLMYNNTISNTPTGVRMISDTTIGPFVQGDTADDVFVLTLLHNSFNNNGTALSTLAEPARGGTAFNLAASVRWLAMDNIFANSSVEGITAVGQQAGSQGQYNLFFGNASNFSVTNQSAGRVDFFGGFTNGIVTLDPAFRNPAAGDLRLRVTSGAIDSALSEFGPNIWGNEIEPTVTITSPLDPAGEPRNGTGRQGLLGADFNQFGPIPSRQLVRLVGSGQRVFPDQWVPAVPGTPGAFTGPGSVAGSYPYLPVIGERDQSGFLRQDVAGRANVGNGSKPFFDLGAFEYRQFVTPHVTAVTASSNGRPINIYGVNTIAGSNAAPQAIAIMFDRQIDPTTINGQSVQLYQSGGDGQFSAQDGVVGNSPSDRRIDLSGKLSFDPNTRVLTINLAGLNLTSDLYRLVLRGEGANVLRDTQGNVLDGENIVNGDPDGNGPQRALPSGDGDPGGNFFVTFSVDTTAPSVVPRTFILSAASDGTPRDLITNNNRPSFTGTITDVFPPTGPAVGQTVVLDISTKGNGVFDRLNAGTATTTAVPGNPSQGQFTVSVTGAPLPDSPAKVGANGILNIFDGDTTGFSYARIRVVDQSGNSSNVADPNALTPFIVDTRAPQVFATIPVPNAQVSSAGQIVVTLALNENLNPGSVNANNVRVTRSGGDGIIGNANDAIVPVQSIILSPVQAATGFQAIAVVLSAGLPNDIYNVQLIANGVSDLAGNPLASAYNLPFVIFGTAQSNVLFVGPGQTYSMISQAIAAANVGDVVAVLPGIYNEQVVLKSLVRVLAVSPSSGTTLGSLVPGDPKATVIRAPQLTNGNVQATVVGVNLISNGIANTEIAGFTIASPLDTDPAGGPIIGGSFGVYLANSDVLVDRNYIIDSAIGVGVIANGSGASTPRIRSNGIIGNTQGVVINDVGATTAVSKPVELTNNTIAFNTVGTAVTDLGASTTLATVSNNIFWQNNDKSAARNGAGIIASAPGKVTLQYNLFGVGNGPSANNNAINIGGLFNPTPLIATNADLLGNLIGNPAFLFPVDPRPNGEGPARFFVNGNFNIGANSLAIDNALQAVAPPTDLLNRARVDIPGVGFGNRGPADIGALEFNGTAPVVLSSAAVRAKAATLDFIDSPIVSAFTRKKTV